MFHGEKGERYLYKDAADISCRVLIHCNWVHMAIGRLNISCVRKSVVDISSANLASLPPPPLPPLPCYDSPLHCHPCHWNPHQHI